MLEIWEVSSWRKKGYTTIALINNYFNCTTFYKHYSQDYPFHVLIQAMTDDGPNICGGVILNETHVLTAGSCLTDEEDEFNFLPTLRVNIVGGFVSNERCNSVRQRSWV